MKELTFSSDLMLHNTFQNSETTENLTYFEQIISLNLVCHRVSRISTMIVVYRSETEMSGVDSIDEGCTMYCLNTSLDTRSELFNYTST